MNNNNTITLQPGSWHIEAAAPISEAGNNQLRLRNTETDEILQYGMSLNITLPNTYLIAPLTAIFNITNPITVTLEQFCETQAVLGFPASNVGDGNAFSPRFEVYSTIVCTKLS